MGVVESRGAEQVRDDRGRVCEGVNGERIRAKGVGWGLCVCVFVRVCVCVWRRRLVERDYSR